MVFTENTQQEKRNEFDENKRNNYGLNRVEMDENEKMESDWKSMI